MRGRALLAAGVAGAVAALALGFALYRAGATPLPAGTGIAVRGHYDADLSGDGTLVPLFLGKKRPVGICFSPAPEVDTSRWTARLTLAGRPLAAGRFLDPAVRMATTLCFEVPPPDPRPQGPVELCAFPRDGEEGARLPRVCRRVRFGLPAEGKAWGALQGDLQTLMERGGLPLDTWLRELDALAARIERAGFPFLAVQARLVGVSYCRREGAPAALAEARRRLAALPRWLLQPAASWQAGQAAQEASAIDLAAFRLEAAWNELRLAERHYLRVAHAYRFMVAVQQAEILALVGATEEGAGRLRAALAECDRAPCEENLLPTAYGQLAWLIQLDPDASPRELEEARGLLEKALSGPAALHNPAEKVNWQINFAYLQVRQGRDPAEDLRAARELLRGSAGGWERFFFGWSDAIEGWAAIAQGDPRRALDLCGRWTEEGASPRLAARALSCAAAAYRRLGEPEPALWSLEQALLLHEVAGPAQLGQRLPLGPSQRADDYYEAVRLAVDLGEPQRAWDLLDRLDRLAASEEGERHCRGGAADPTLERRRAETARERDLLLSRALALDLPASGERRRQLETVRRNLKEQLQELSRRSLPCPGAEGGGAEGEKLAGFRAVPLPDEILLLHRDGAGSVTLDHRSAFDRRELHARVERIAEELDRRTLSDEEWRRLLAPLAEALVPRQPENGGAVLRYALHGPLQGVPLAALPLAGSTSPWAQASGRAVVARTGARPLWLSDLATLAVLPAGLSARPALPGDPVATPLFVVDPRGDLPGGSELAALYGRAFPGATVLRGEAADRARFRRELRRASLLHLDTHGLYDPAFPELSSLVLADGTVSLSELASLPSPSGLVNLSGCRTGEWPVTADSGRYGLAGLFARRGAAWVVASRADLDDGVARDFNRAFYEAAGAGAGTIESYRRALAAVRGSRPAVAWGGLLLLRGAGPARRGEEP